MGGRSSVSGLAVTVFGASGFVGRYLVNKLGQIGSRIVIPFRGNEGDVGHLRQMADLGQIYPLRFDLRSPTSIHECVKDSDVVINLVAQDRPSFNFSIRQVNYDGALRIASVCKEANVSKLIHVSSALADARSPSETQKTKGEAEEGLRQNFPDTIIARPAVLFGHEDRFLNVVGLFSALPFGYPVVNHGQAIRSPLYVGDFAEALLRLAQASGYHEKQFRGKTFDLIGPNSYTMRQVIDFFAKSTLREHPVRNVPPWLLLLYSKLFPEWRRPVYTRNHVRELLLDEPKAVAAGHLGFQDLGLARLQTMEDLSLAFTRGFRPVYAFARPQQS